MVEVMLWQWRKLSCCGSSRNGEISPKSYKVDQTKWQDYCTECAGEGNCGRPGAAKVCVMDEGCCGGGQNHHGAEVLCRLFYLLVTKNLIFYGAM